MEFLRNNPPKELGGIQVLAVRDYQSLIRKSLADGSFEKIDLPQSNVLYFELENNGWCCVRPSGTEPKIKFYFGVKSSSTQSAREILKKIKNKMFGLLSL